MGSGLGLEGAGVRQVPTSLRGTDVDRRGGTSRRTGSGGCLVVHLLSHPSLVSVLDGGCTRGLVLLRHSRFHP